MDLSAEEECTQLSPWKRTEMKTDMFWITFHGICLQGIYCKVRKKVRNLAEGSRNT